MAENSKIEWCNHSWNPWIGCQKISPACDNCYAESWDKRYEGGKHWGPKAPRRRTSPGNWNKPLKWNRDAEKAGTRPRVFCASLADVFDNNVPISWRADLWTLIDMTPNLDWLLLTKRPQNIKKMMGAWDRFPDNVWLGVTVENQEEADRRIPHLLSVPAAIHFLSCEPLLGPVNLVEMVSNGNIANALTGDIYFSQINLIKNLENIDWVIAGGESGPGARPMHPDWVRGLRDQCLAAGVPFLFKQWEGRNQSDIKLKGRELDGKVWDEYPNGKNRRNGFTLK